MDVISVSPVMTRAIGAAVATQLHVGDVVVLTGELGTGKTVFAQGVGQGLGVTEPIVSPTFTLVREYEGRIPLHHLDVYRLDREQEAIDLGLDELFDGAVTVIEWGEGVRSLLPSDRLEVALELLSPDVANDDVRRIGLVGLGPRWSASMDALVASVDAAMDAASSIAGEPSC